MSLNFFLFLVMLGPDASPLQRKDRQDTIYIVQGNSSTLTAFHQNTGQRWPGGTVIDDDPSDQKLTYWAYSSRTAAQSRMLILPAIMGQLHLSFEEYREEEQFPSLRRQLDKIALGCGAKSDPFFLTPKRSLEVSLPSDTKAELRTCLMDGVRLNNELSVLPIQQSQE